MLFLSGEVTPDFAEIFYDTQHLLWIKSKQLSAIHRLSGPLPLPGGLVYPLPNLPPGPLAVPTPLSTL